MEQTTRDRLAWAAAKLFQERGFHGVGLSEILAVTGLPKGSLYHHFPNGKADLALEAAALAHRETSRIIDDAFQGADDYQDGATTLLFKMAKLFELMGKHTGCPVSEILSAGPDHPDFRKKSSEYFDGWTNQIQSHAERLGDPPDVARKKAEHLFLALQGGWTLARAKQDGDVLRDIPSLIFAD